MAKVRSKGDSATRERLLEAAVDTIATGGEVAVRTKTIAQSAGVAETSLFHFFGNREGLIEEANVALFRKLIEGFTQNFKSAVDACATRAEFIDVCRRTVELATSKDRSHVRAQRVQALGSAVNRPRLAEKLFQAQLEANKIMQDSLEIAQSRKWISADLDTEAASFWLTAQFTGYVVAELGNDDEYLEKIAHFYQIAVAAILEFHLTDEEI